MQAIRIIILLALAVTCSAVNLIPNSSFEVGTGRGWINFGNGDSAFLGNTLETRALLTNDAWHGSKSFIVKGLTYTRGVWLASGTYTFSFYAKASGSAGPFYHGLLDGGNLYEIAPPASSTITTSWARYSSQFTVSTNGFYWGKFYTFQAETFQVDAFQLEPGGTATAYAPQNVVEAGLSIPNTNNVWFAGNNATFNLNFWNNGAAGTALADYSVYDLWNSNVLSGRVSVSLATSNSAISTVSLPNRYGWLRVTSRVLGQNDSWDEATTVVYPYTSNIVANATTDWLGGHPHASPFHIRRELLANRKWGRLLSPNYAGTRWTSIEPTRGNFTWNDWAVTNLSSGGMSILIPLTPATDGSWNPWATNANGSADLMAWSNYTYQVALRYKDLDPYFEVGPNEPYQSGPITPINVQEATNYATVLTYGIRGITNAYPAAKIIGIAGAYGAGEWAWEAWTNLTAASQAAISIISTHIYPPDQGLDPNDVEFESTHFSNAGGWIEKFGALRPVWNTESGDYGIGPLKGLNSIWPGSYNLYATYAQEAIRSEGMNRQVSSTVRISTQALRCIGHGMEKYFYYDSRYFQDAAFLGVQPYPADYLQVDRPEIASLSVATHFIRKGFGKITNAAAANLLEMYSYTNGTGQAVVAAWSNDRTNRTLTLTNSFLAVYDVQGNQIQTNVGTVLSTRLPRYLVSGTLSLAQLSNTVAYASLANTADTTPPQISFDIGPVGVWNGGEAHLIKWTALDERWTAWTTAGTATNVLYKWNLDSGPYSAYSQSNHVWLTGLVPGLHKVAVSAMDANGNTAEAIYDFMPERRTVNAGTLSAGRFVLAQ